ncbi:deoxyhypusine hydroxylase [Perkinsela sp. CCAP 1560/4]|nr:deoxyhypusine hydroxylase [Perkinsela sp. CCAP 1560/4]|eukprot:KNH09549.1 deoxyhypusine hydroxylase [Perkinsela sp. CCAP 1560/4]
MADLEKTLLDVNCSLSERVRALHDIRECDLPDAKKAECLMSAVKTTRSALLLHEIMYEIGQICNADIIPFLQNVILDSAEDVVTRHEAAEALGAIQSPLALDFLHEISRQYTEEGNSKIPVELAETCDLAIERIAAKPTNNEPSSASPYSSIDPALPHPSQSIEDMRALLDTSHLNDSTSLYNRYAALFRMRDAHDVEGLCHSLCTDRTSALLRHEIAFVLGQMEDKGSVECLCTVLADATEHSMVRHEVAEALGSIATPTCLNAIEACLQNPDEDELVKDSCIVALDMYEYYKNWSNANRAIV